ncbi:DUF7024 domain-containing protein, partial [Vibrio cholerae]|uniref:DUF7024 domain-containing protein n=2 Tax=Vibrio cholerae TaxID=666 RepID=UPI00155E1824
NNSWNEINNIIEKSELNTIVKIPRYYFMTKNISIISPDTLASMISNKFDKELLVCDDYSEMSLAHMESLSLSGFYDWEGIGRWTKKSESSLIIPVALEKGTIVSFSVVNAIGKNKSSPIEVFLNNQKELITLDEFFPKDQKIKLNENVEELNIRIKIPYPTKPIDLGIEDDVRELGIMIGKVAIYRPNNGLESASPIEKCIKY